MSTLRVKCPFCAATFINDNNRQTHLRKFHPNAHAGNNFILEFSENARNIPNDPVYIDFLNDFNITTDSSDYSDGESVLEDSANQIPKKIYLFKESVTLKLKNNLNFIVGLLNICSLINKFEDIRFTLDDGLVDILVIQETHLDSNRCDSIFHHPKYHMIRRDRKNDSPWGGLIVYILIKPTLSQLLKLISTLKRSTLQ